MWLSVLKSGVHATLAGVLLAMFIPLRTRSGASPLLELEHGLRTTVSFAVLPLFALANCGVTLLGIGTKPSSHRCPSASPRGSCWASRSACSPSAGSRSR